ncbi:MAG: formate/nitrite transporter family protein [Lachnospiraceae bacterium]|jgi:formate/nitrite transporter
MNNFNTPAETVIANTKAAEIKASLPLGKMILLGLLAGGFIAFGGAAGSTAAHGLADAGLVRFVSGIVFPLGLIMIVLCGGELFTGNCLMGMAALNKQIKWSRLVRNLVVVWPANFVGAFVIALCVFMAGNFDIGGGALGAFTIKVAVGKAALGIPARIFSGVVCNILVCMGVLLAGAAKDAIGKIFGAFFSVFTFIIIGAEHCVANMYYFPAALLAKTNPLYVAKAQELFGLSAAQIEGLNIGSMFNNLLFVTLGNIIGGGILVGVTYYLIYVRKKEN